MSTKASNRAALLGDLVLPLAAYYGFRAGGASEFTALVVSGLPPALGVVYNAVRNRRVDGMGLFVLCVVLLNLAAAALSGDARTLLVRGGWIGLLAAAWTFGSLFFARRPTTYHAVKAFLPGKTDQLEHFWETRPGFRRVWRVLAVIWGCGMLATCALNLVFAYTLPVDSVPALDTVVQIGTSVLLQIVTQIALRREGTMRQLWAQGPRAKAPAIAGKESE
jgi:hypothetical protein